MIGKLGVWVDTHDFLEFFDSKLGIESSTVFRFRNRRPQVLILRLGNRGLSIARCQFCPKFQALSILGQIVQNTKNFD